MRLTKPTRVVAVVAAIAAIGCSDPVTPAASIPDPPETDTRAVVDFKLKALTPDVTYNDGGAPLVLETENGCAPADVQILVWNIPLTAPPGGTVDRYEFPAPPFPPNFAATVQVIATCKAPTDATKRYGSASVTASLRYDPALEAEPRVVQHGPTGEDVPILATMTVRFSGDIDPQTVTRDTVFLEGLAGETRYVEATRTATFTAAGPLAYGTSYTAVVRGGANGVRTRHGRTLELTGLGAPVVEGVETWSFRTRPRGVNDPVVGGVAAAAGELTGPGFKLFTVTGRGATAGEASSSTDGTRLETGFLPTATPR